MQSDIWTDIYRAAAKAEKTVEAINGDKIAEEIRKTLRTAIAANVKDAGDGVVHPEDVLFRLNEIVGKETIIPTMTPAALREMLYPSHGLILLNKRV